MNLGGLSLRDLEYAVAVRDEGHFGRAALRCNVSQPALSAQVRKLEQTLGVQLFERTSRRVLTTGAGEAVVGQARRVLAEAQRIFEVARTGRGGGLRGRLALAAIQTLGPYLFPRILRPLREAFPDLALTLSEARTHEIVEGLREGRLDAALLSLPLDEAGLTTAALFTEPFLLACPAGHALAAAPDLGDIDLAGPDLLLLDEGNCLRDQALAACGSSAAGRHATSLETLRSMVAAGGGYTIIPHLAARDEPDGTELLIYRRFDDRTPGRTIALAYRSSDPRAADFLALADFFRGHAPEGTVAS